MRAALALVLATLALAACGSDDRPIVVNTPPAPASSTVVVPAPSQTPIIVAPKTP